MFVLKKSGNTVKTEKSSAVLWKVGEMDEQGEKKVRFIVVGGGLVNLEKEVIPRRMNGNF